MDFVLQVSYYTWEEPEGMRGEPIYGYNSLSPLAQVGHKCQCSPVAIKVCLLYLLSGR